MLDKEENENESGSEDKDEESERIKKYRVGFHLLLKRRNVYRALSRILSITTSLYLEYPLHLSLIHI